MKHEPLLPCPFCGDDVEIEDSVSCLDITCCCSMGIQKCDVLTATQRKTLNMNTYRYSDEAEQFAINNLISKWNSREDGKNLTELSRWLMGYVMELHDFRSKLTSRKHLESMTEELKDEIMLKFPMLQGTQNQRRFRELGLSDFSQDKVKSAIKYIEQNRCT